MTTQDVIDFYGSKTAIAEALDCTKSCISMWGEYPPNVRQYELEALTKGKLKATPIAKPSRRKVQA